MLLCNNRLRRRPAGKGGEETGQKPFAEEGLVAKIRKDDSTL